MSSRFSDSSCRNGEARSIWQSPIGPILIRASRHGVSSVEFVDKSSGATVDKGPSSDDGAGALIAKAVAQLEEYFARTRTSFDLALELNGTPFQRAVWDCVRQVPYGRTISYRALADAAGRPAAIRAAGAANGANPLSILIPCHRIVGSNGSLTGYAGGLDRKRYLLDLESGAIWRG
jgi:methylated-DNA-[protein]-cysteine S-methyltransferase